MDGRAKQINIYAFVDLPGLMWTGQGNEKATGSEALAYNPRLVDKKTREVKYGVIVYNGSEVSM